MISSARRLVRKAEADDGFTLIEVLVAMMVFAIIAVAVAYSLTSGLVTTRDARAREVASGLAAQDIDVSRSINDVKTVLDKTTTTTLDGVTYTVKRTTGWISSDGSDATCGSDGGVLQYKHVNVRVSWTGARISTSTVQSDTLIAPNGRLNDPAMGTILVSVIGANGSGVPGISVSVAPAASKPNGALTVDPAPLDTDAQGCSYVLKVAPGNYDVTITKAGGGYVSEKQLATVTQTVGVDAGDSTSANFQYDQAGRITVNYASNGPAAVIFPSLLDVNFASDNSIYQPDIAVPTTKKVDALLHPFASGYSIFTGAYVAPSTDVNGLAQPTCLSPDPGAWAPNASNVVGRRPAAVATIPGGTAAVDVPMGVVTVSGILNLYITAVSATASSNVGDPGCGVPMTYQFSTKNLTASSVIALPYGSWTLYSGLFPGAKTLVIPASAVTLPAGSPTNTSPSVFTLDPRVIAP